MKENCLQFDLSVRQKSQIQIIDQSSSVDGLQFYTWLCAKRVAEFDIQFMLKYLCTFSCVASVALYTEMAYLI